MSHEQGNTFLSSHSKNFNQVGIKKPGRNASHPIQISCRESTKTEECRRDNKQIIIISSTVMDRRPGSKLSSVQKTKIKKAALIQPFTKYKKPQQRVLPIQKSSKCMKVSTPGRNEPKTAKLTQQHRALTIQACDTVTYIPAQFSDEN